MRLLRQLRVTDFRNFASLTLDLSSGLNLFIGDNGQGKTNLLEAVYFLSLLRSFRTQDLQDLRRWRCPTCVVSGVVSTAVGDQTIGVEFGARRRLRVDGQNVARASEFINNLSCVALVPEDLALIKGSPAGRRRFLDVILSQLHPAYLGLLQQYLTALRSRTLLLRREPLPAAELAAYESVLVQRGAPLWEYRRRFFEQFAAPVQELARQFYPADQELTVTYHPRLPVTTTSTGDELLSAFAAALAAGRETDRQRGQTQLGPHRDDFVVSLAGKPVDRFGSEGQARLAALVLRLATVELLLASQTTDGVVLLVDDVIGELDARARAAFFGTLQRAGQVLLAATANNLPSGLTPAAVFQVAAGQVTPPPVVEQ